MTQTAALLAALKAHLRAAGITYAQVAVRLDLSEASVKRLFARQALSLQRLEQICELGNISLGELVEMVERRQSRVERLSQVQEEEIAADPLLLLVAVSVINGFTYRDILDHYEVSEAECIQKLARLDRLKLIELLPGNRVKLRVASNFRWTPGGPIQRFFLEHVAQDFFDSRFDGEAETLLVLNGLISTAGNHQLQEKIDWLGREFVDRTKRDSVLSMEEKHGTTLVVGLRKWRYRLFESYQAGAKREAGRVP